MDPRAVQGQARGRIVRRKLVYICDWLPPDFGAVGQYSLMFAREHAAEGLDVVLAGLSSQGDSVDEETHGDGRLRVLRLRADPYDKSDFLRRSWWTLKVNLRLVRKLWRDLWKADEIKFTGSPPFMLHVLAPLNVCVLRKTLTYRITDFHPESLMATMDRVPWLLRCFYKVTLFWRRRVDRLEVLGRDQQRLLEEIGIPDERILLKRDPSPVVITAETQPLERPAELRGLCILLYSGNYGVAHEHETFVEAYRRHHAEGSRRVGFWLNAVGRKADEVENALRRHNLPVYRSRPVALNDLGGLLVAPDAHLITLRDSFVGLVLPSKVYGCIESKRPIIYVGSRKSDVHLLCSKAAVGEYWHIDVGDVAALVMAFESLADRTGSPHTVGPVQQGSR